MEDKDYLAHLKSIKGIIEERTKFKALSGLSGVIAGVFALIGAYVANHIIYTSERLIYTDVRNDIMNDDLIKLLLVALFTLIGAASTALFFSWRNARKSGTKFWSKAAAKLFFNFSVPMVMGGIFVLALLWRGDYTLIAPSCLIFYGLALFNAANYTFSDIRALGMAILFIGTISLFFPGNGLILWALGFGVLHIIYGTIMYFKYEK